MQQNLQLHSFIFKFYTYNKFYYKPTQTSMSDQIDPQALQQQTFSQDPEYELQEHITFRRKQQAQGHIFKKLIQQNVFDISLIMDGTTFAFTKLSLKNRGIQQITEAIDSYPHLRIIDLSFNQLHEISYLEKLKYVVELNLQNNMINDIKFLQISDNFPYLKTLNLQGNKVHSLSMIQLQNLIQLNLNSNKINSLMDFAGHEKLQILQLRKNKLTSLKGLANLPNLKELYLADNQLTSLNGISKTSELTKIHARKNKIESLAEFPQISSLKYLNLRENQVKNVDSLRGIPESVEILNILACPLSEQLGDNTKKQVWMKFRHYEKINKSEVGAEQKQDFDKEYKDRLAEQQRERLEKQAAEKQAREAAERQAAEKQG